MLCGMWHGCSFPPPAFVLVVELLAIEIRNRSVAGIETSELGERASVTTKKKRTILLQF